MTITDRYIFIENAAKEEINRLSLSPGYLKSFKIQEIKASVDRLYLAVIQQYPEFQDKHQRNTEGRIIDPIQAKKIDLTTLTSMLNVTVNEWQPEITPWTVQDFEFQGRPAEYIPQKSLRTALNIAQNNPFNFFLFSSWGPLWGKTRALENVEKKLNRIITNTNKS